jgi:hypothetical protein
MEAAGAFGPREKVFSLVVLRLFRKTTKEKKLGA